jgi:hypothetical protein
MAAISAGARAFREAYLSAENRDDGRAWGDVDARRMRYDIFEAYYDNTAYRRIHTWSNAMKAEYGLYRYTRGVYNPTFRLIEFWAAHTLGGALDPAAGDGKTVPSALPIIMDTSVGVRNEKALRAAIARTWRVSNWQTNKTQLPRTGAKCGDAAIRVVDDTLRQQVRLEVIHPRNIGDVTKDPQGNVRGYRLEWDRPDPRPGARPDATVTAAEVARRDGDLVVYQTLLNGEPYAWNGVAHTWEEAYGFVPLVLVQHMNVGLPWGWSELHAGLPKFREVDDLASKLHDQIRKTVDAPWLFAGLKAPTASPTVPQTADTGTTARAESGREEVPALYSTDANAKAQPLVAPLDIAGVSAEIAEGLRELERDYPELQMDIWTASGDASGRALRVARQRVESKVLPRRADYDDAVVRAQQMAVAIGGFREYEGYQGFGLDSYRAGQLDHRIGERPVFAVDPADELEMQAALLANVAAAQAVGMDPRAYLVEYGYSQERVDRLFGVQEPGGQPA